MEFGKDPPQPWERICFFSWRLKLLVLCRLYTSNRNIPFCTTVPSRTQQLKTYLIRTPWYSDCETTWRLRSSVAQYVIYLVERTTARASFSRPATMYIWILRFDVSSHSFGVLLVAAVEIRFQCQDFRFCLLLIELLFLEISYLYFFLSCAWYSGWMSCFKIVVILQNFTRTLAVGISRFCLQGS